MGKTNQLNLTTHRASVLPRLLIRFLNPVIHHSNHSMLHNTNIHHRHIHINSLHIPTIQRANNAQKFTSSTTTTVRIRSQWTVTTTQQYITDCSHQKARGEKMQAPRSITTTTRRGRSGGASPVVNRADIDTNAGEARSTARTVLSVDNQDGASSTMTETVAYAQTALLQT